MNDEPALAAGDFSAWMAQIRAAIRGEGQADVPCGGCTACCTSSQFVHIGPDETDTLSHVPAELLFPAPRLPPGHVLLGYDERGHCPMLVDNRCSIYEHRPRTCRTYDCRVFPAAGLEVDDDDDKAVIASRARRWQFRLRSEADRAQQAAVRAAAAFLAEHPGLLPDGRAGCTPGAALVTNATQLALAAIEIHDLFLRRDGDTGAVVDPDPEVVRVELLRRMESTDTP